jgi:hypothetical protein
MRKIKEILNGQNELVFHDMCSLDFRLWAERVFGMQVKQFHLDMLNLVHTNRFSVIKCFRGGGKTTFLGVIYPLWLCFFKPGTHILFTASELKQATKILDEVKEWIENNEYLNELMPPNPSTWRQTELKMTNGSRIFCKAYTPHIKGIHVNYVFCDEIQDCTDRDIFNKAIAPTVNHKKGHICCVGTPDNPGDLLEELTHRAEYKSLVIPVVLKAGVSIWPEKFPMDEIEKIRKRDGEPAFQTQYMMNANAESEGAVYPADWLNNCIDHKSKFVEKKLHEKSTTVLGADFAISKGSRADFDAYVVLEKIGNKSSIVWGERHKGLPKDAKVQRLVDLYNRYKPIRMVLDPSGIGEAIIQELRQQALPVEAGEFHSKARNQLLVNLMTMIQPNTDGESELVIPRDSEDPLTLNFTTKLIEELLSFKEQKSEATGMISILSKGPHDDTVMALALACKAAAQQREFLDMVAI